MLLLHYFGNIQGKNWIFSLEILIMGIFIQKNTLLLNNQDVKFTDNPILFCNPHGQPGQFSAYMVKPLIYILVHNTKDTKPTKLL